MTFPHHNYQNDPSEGAHEFLAPAESDVCVGLASDSLPGCGQILREFHVRKILLLHGTFAGGDALGIVREISKVSSRTGHKLKDLGKQVVDQLVGETGNYTQSFARNVSRIVNDEFIDRIEVNTFDWTGENHHFGRLEAAIAFVRLLLEQHWEPTDRLLVWGHSHGGNVLALVTHLLAAEEEALREVFAIKQCFGKDNPRKLPECWDIVAEELLGSAKRQFPVLDVVTFGTPVQYRWETSVSPRPVHFVHHRPLHPEHPARAELPSTAQEVLSARGGDYVQQLGIAGTNFFPNVLAWGSWRAERKIRSMLQPRIRRRDLVHNLKRGHRVSLDGLTLLVDYPDVPPGARRELFGHGIYTRSEWLPFHLRESLARLYRRTA